MEYKYSKHSLEQILEPLDVDLLIENSTLTEEDTIEISKYIQQRKIEILKEEFNKQNLLKNKKLKAKAKKVVN